MRADKKGCTLSLTPETLSSWLRHMVSPGEYVRIQQHIKGCTQCQETIQAYEKVDQLVRLQHIPIPNARLWRDVQEGIVMSKNGERHLMKRRQIIQVLSAAMLVVAAIIASVLILPHLQRSQGTVADQPLHATASQGWVQPSALAFGKNIAFAWNKPLIGYACGSQSEMAVLPIQISITIDGGRIWKQLPPAPYSGNGCSISIDPQNEHDLVLVGSTSVSGNDFSFTHLRSLDGGLHWTPISFPSTPASQSNSFTKFFWSGSTLIAVTDSEYSTLSHPHRIAASFNGGAMTWIDTKNDIQGDESIQEAFALGNTLYFFIRKDTGPNSYGPGDYEPGVYVQTNDFGETWTRAKWNGQDETPSLMVGNDGKTLYDFSSPVGPIATTPPYVARSSQDGGKTWQQVPQLPAGTAFPRAAFPVFSQAPDGTIYSYVAPVAPSNSVNPAGIYKLSPGTNHWVSVEPLQIDKDTIDEFTISADAQGHPTALWITKESLQGSAVQGGYFSQTPGIIYHAP